MNTGHPNLAMPVDDQVINRIFECGMALAAALGRPDVGDETRRRLLGVIADLDGVIRTVREAALVAAFPTPPESLTALCMPAGGPEFIDEARALAPFGGTPISVHLAIVPAIPDLIG